MNGDHSNRGRRAVNAALFFLILFSCDSITFSEENDPSLMYELEIIADLFEDQGLTWNLKGLPFTLTFDDTIDSWGHIEKTSQYFHIRIHPDAENYQIVLLMEIGHLNGLKHSDGYLMGSGGFLEIIAAVWPWNKDQYLKEYFELIKLV